MLQNISQAWDVLKSRTAQGSIRSAGSPAPEAEFIPGVLVDPDDEPETDALGNLIHPKADPSGEFVPGKIEEI
jgi:hypothetical protein